jgi:hypothetical protein
MRHLKRIVLVSAALVFAVSTASVAEEGSASGSPSAGHDVPKRPQGPAAPTPSKKSSSKAAPKGIHLSPTTPVAASANVHDKVLDQCNLQTLLPQQIASHNPDIVLSDAPGAMKLDIRIVDVHAPSGGFFSGPKWITVEGKLLQGKTVKGSFIAKETSMASVSACGMLSKVVTVLASDIAAWLAHPTKGALLGSAR